MNKLLIATHNKGKIRELAEFLSELPVKLISLSDLHITHDVEENGDTYEVNSQKKATEYAKLSGLPAIADDGGLEISALNGEPGVRSRRWLGHTATDEEIIAHMKKVAKDLPDNNRTAHFKTVVTFALPDGKFWSTKNEIKGIIAKNPLMKILSGYPYRSFFYLPEIQKYYHESELSTELMSKYNHRYQAVNALKPRIIKELAE